MNYEIKKFKNRKDLKTYIGKVLKNLDGKFEYNIFMHHINDYDEDNSYEPGDKLRQNKMENIMKNGLSISRYASIFGTVKIVGDSSVDPENIVDYKYYMNDRTACCILAIPKYVMVDGKKVEFSSFEGVSSYERPKALMDEYRKQNKPMVIRHHLKSCLYDAIKGYEDLPKCYTLGLIYETKMGEFYYINPHTHLSELSEQEQEKYAKEIEIEVLKAYKKYGTRNLSKLIVKAYGEEEKLREDDYLNFD